MKSSSWLFLLCFPLFLSAAPRDAGALVLVNSQAPDFSDFKDTLEPYFRQFGLPYRVLDVAAQPALQPLDDSALVILGHRGLNVPRPRVDEAALMQAVENGTGLVSFDGLLALWKGSQPHNLYRFPKDVFGLSPAAAARADRIRIAALHFITACQPVPREISLKTPVPVPGLTGNAGTAVLATAGDQPLLLAAGRGRGRVVLFTSYAWARPEIKGKMYGLDDLVWRSLVWAARKPFVLRHLPNFVNLRVDDVSGFGKGSNAHLGWVETCNRYGLKPWMGVFVDDLFEDPASTRALSRLTQAGQGTASVHAFRNEDFLFLEDELLTDENAVFMGPHPWSDGAQAAKWARVEALFQKNNVVKSKVVIPHQHEYALNSFAGLKAWGTEYTGTILPPDRGYGTTLLRIGPYLTGEPSRASNTKDPLYVADWLPGSNQQFFNFSVEIRDVAEFEWTPSGVPPQEAVRRGVAWERRCFDSLVPAILFTHESEHIRHIEPADWESIIQGLMAGLKSYRPISVTLDYLGQYVRALHTSKPRAVRFDPATGQGTLELEGKTDLPTRFYVYGEDGQAREFEAPPFQAVKTIKFN